MKAISYALAASVGAFSLAAPVAAQDTQTLQVVSGTDFFRSLTVSAFDPLGQTFTAFSDTITSVGFQFVTLNNTAANAPLSLSIYAGEALSSASLFDASFVLPTSVDNRNTPVWVDIPVSSLAVMRDQTYSLVLRASSSRAALVLGPGYRPTGGGQFFGGDAYADGKLIGTGISYANCLGAANNCDANFRVSGEVFAAAVPEPSAWAMMILGFGVVGAGLRTRRKAAWA